MRRVRADPVLADELTQEATRSFNFPATLQDKYPDQFREELVQISDLVLLLSRRSSFSIAFSKMPVHDVVTLSSSTRLKFLARLQTPAQSTPHWSARLPSLFADPKTTKLHFSQSHLST